MRTVVIVGQYDHINYRITDLTFLEASNFNVPDAYGRRQSKPTIKTIGQPLQDDSIRYRQKRISEDPKPAGMMDDDSQGELNGKCNNIALSSYIVLYGYATHIVLLVTCQVDS